jgi:hypothetical protein
MKSINKLRDSLSNLPDFIYLKDDGKDSGG